MAASVRNSKGALGHHVGNAQQQTRLSGADGVAHLQLGLNIAPMGFAAGVW